MKLMRRGELVTTTVKQEVAKQIESHLSNAGSRIKKRTQKE